ncbi:MAG: hypothetical protein CM15mP74_24370 [Halieaceae bacterium]|nr:MAG: hypothetical protein CM15mP74_24370 [Halieaceae bacterium]
MQEFAPCARTGRRGAPEAEAPSCRFQMQRCLSIWSGSVHICPKAVRHSSMSQLAVNDIQPGSEVLILQQ